VSSGFRATTDSHSVSEAGKRFPMWSRSYIFWEGSYDYSEGKKWVTNPLNRYIHYNLASGVNKVAKAL
jgi:hypothetical protein